MTTDFRALCAELVRAIDTLLGQGESPANLGERLILTVHLEELEDCANQTRAELDKPEPVAPTRPDCFDFAMDFVGDPEETEVRRYVEALEARPTIQPEPVAPTDEELEGLAEVMNVSGNPVPAMRRALELWGTPAIQLVPVSERLPGP
jgi:hypothetical protein